MALALATLPPGTRVQLQHASRPVLVVQRLENLVRTDRAEGGVVRSFDLVQLVLQPEGGERRLTRRHPDAADRMLRDLAVDGYALVPDAPPE